MIYKGHEGATLRNGFTYSWVRGGPMLEFFLDLPWFQIACRVRCKLAKLQKLAGDVTPAFEDVAERLKRGGVDVPINVKPEPATKPKERKIPMQVSTAMPALVAPKSNAKSKGKKR